MLIAATHTHSAPAAMGALGCPADPAYVELLPGRIAESIAQGPPRTWPRPGSAGASIDDDQHTFCRRWIRRPDRMLDDPFGNRTVRANMHPGHVNPDAIAPSGPVDPALTMLAIQTTEGRPDRRPGQLFAALLRRVTRLGRLLRPVRHGAGPPDRRGAGESPPVRRHHVAGHQRRPDVDGLRPAQE